MSNHSDKMLRAVKNDDVPGMRKAIHAGAKVHFRHCTYLHRAAAMNCIKAAMYLLEEEGIDVNTEDKNGKTPLRRAVEGYEKPRAGETDKSLRTINLLMAAGATIDNTDLSLAMKHGGRALRRYLRDIADDPKKRPSAAEVGLDMARRNAAINWRQAQEMGETFEEELTRFRELVRKNPRDLLDGPGWKK